MSTENDLFFANSEITFMNFA